MAIRIVGIDTSLRSTGIAVVEARGNKFSAVQFKTIRTAPDAPHSQCLLSIHRGVADIIDEHKPSAASIEGAFFAKNAKTAMILGEARGVVIAVCAMRNLPVYEYAPRRVKQSVVGFGNADKKQVQKMVMSILGISEIPQADAADALAIALCHLHNTTSYGVLAPNEV